MVGAPWRPYERRYDFPGGITLTLGERTLVMGILNVTPDSFSDGGKFLDPAAAEAHARAMVEAGADLVDVGGESTRPGHAPVSAAEEWARLEPVLERLRAAVRTPISVDTYKPEVADRALKAGAHILNDIWGFRRDPEMAAVAARHGCPVVLMHNREQPVYNDLLSDMKRDLEISVEIALKAGVKPENIWLDPGIGFGKTLEHNLTVMRHLHEIVALGFPVLLGTSRKSMIQRTLSLPPDQVLEGTAATVALGIAQGCQIMRVHDVAAMSKTIRMTDAMMGVVRSAQE
jgi:dihydropteroate synthase